MSEHVRQVVRRGKPVWVIDHVYPVVTVDGTGGIGTRQRYRRDAEVQTAIGARMEHDRVTAHWLANGNITALLAVAQKGPHASSVAESKSPTLTWADLDGSFRETILVGMKASTKRGYEEMLDSRFFLAWQQLPASAIDRACIDEWNAVIATSGVGDSRTRNLHCVMRSVFRSAFEAGKIAAMPRFPKLPKVGIKVIDAASPDDVLAILDERDDVKGCGPVFTKRRQAARLAFKLSIYGGLRASEVRALRWTDVDLRRRMIVVRRASVGGVVDTPKSGNDREIPISTDLLSALEAPNVAARRKADPRGLVAPRGDGKPWGDSGLIQALGRACARLGIAGRRVHSLRHFFVTALFEGGASAPEVQRLAGHASLATTQRYSHTTTDRLRSAIEGLDLLPRRRGNGAVTASESTPR